jgi:hypothetical protein
MSEPRTLRARISAAFNDLELRGLCFEHFPAVEEQFAAGMTKGQMVLLLLSYCRRYKQGKKLLDAIEKERPGLIGTDHAQFLADLENYIPVDESQISMEDLRRRVFTVAAPLQDLRGMLYQGFPLTPAQQYRYNELSKQLENLLRIAPPEFILKFYEDW